MNILILQPNGFFKSSIFHIISKKDAFCTSHKCFLRKILS